MSLLCRETHAILMKQKQKRRDEFGEISHSGGNKV